MNRFGDKPPPRPKPTNPVEGFEQNQSSGRLGQNATENLKPKKPVPNAEGFVSVSSSHSSKKGTTATSDSGKKGNSSGAKATAIAPPKTGAKQVSKPAPKAKKTGGNNAFALLDAE